MQLSVVARIIGLLLMIFSLSMAPPMLVSAWFHDGEFQYFLTTLAAMLGIGLLLWLPVRRRYQELHSRDGFIIVTLFWTVLGVFSSLPFHFSPAPHLSYTDAVFEAVSGFTTTGATVIVGLDNLSPSLLYYRQQLQWLGGMGIIVLAVAVLPLLGIGGMELYRAETPGPMKDEKLTPRIAHTARALWYVYVGLTVACALCFWVGGMSLFDAIGHSFSTISTGGFSTHDASFGYFQSPGLEIIANIFMLLGSINFAVHFLAWQQPVRSKLSYYLQDTETVAFLLIVAGLVVGVAVVLRLENYYPSLLTALRYSAFHVISVISTTGFTTAPFSEWPSILPILLIYISFIGGCAGSTAGGLKVIRLLLLVKQAMREIARMIHPRAVMPVKINSRVMTEPVIGAVWGFFSLYVFSTTALTLLLVGTGLDILSAYSAVAACLNVMGPGLGDVASNFIDVSDTGIWILIFAMLLGRLEIFTVFVLLTPAFWRR
ncbi:MAG: potassium transporter [Gammaproteobacteria bacterium]|nr:potassium transporter [Gammaproteobacteria bacterium]